MTGTCAPLAPGLEQLVAARLMACWWSRPVGEELETWDRLWPEARRTAATIGVDPAALDGLERAAGTSGDALLAEYERLFVGPGRTPCPPYEALWRGDLPRREQGMLMGPATAAVVRLYRELGLSVRADAGELPDHVAVEWEALAYARGLGTEEAGRIADALLEAHLAVWLPTFCDRVEREAAHDFYRTLAGLTPTWVAGLCGQAAAAAAGR